VVPKAPEAKEVEATESNTNEKIESLKPQHINPLPPSPPPRIIPEASKVEGVEASESQIDEKIEILKSERTKPLPPPPPPPRQTTETKERTIIDAKESSSSAGDVSENVLSPKTTEKKSETPDTLPREERVEGLYQYVRQQQQQQYYQQNAYQQDNTMQPNHYPQWQQEQQQQLIATQQGIQGYGAPQRPSALASTIRGLWGKVERGLDDLAGLEGTLAGQAQKLVNTAISTASTAKKMSPSALRSLAQSGAAAAASVPKAASSLGNRNRRKTPSISMGSNAPLRPYGQKYEIAREAKEKEEREKNNQFQPTVNVNSNKKVHDIFLSGDKSKSIGAKGGAVSNPYGYPQEPSSGEDDDEAADAAGESADAKSQPQTNANPEPNKSYSGYWDPQSPPVDSERENRAAPSSSKDSEDRPKTFRQENPAAYRGPPSNGTPYANQDPRGSSGMIPGTYPARPQPRREPQQDPLDSHSRSKRIPWDTNPSSPSARQGPQSPQRQMPPQNIRPRYEDDEPPAWKRAIKSISLPPLPNLGKLRMPRFRRRSNAYSYANLDAWDREEGGKKGGIFGFFKKSSSASSTFPSSSGISSENDKKDATDRQATPVVSMLSRCNNGKSVSLLSSEDLKASRSIGRYKAILDVSAIVLFLLGVKILSVEFTGVDIQSLYQEGKLDSVLPNVYSAVNEFMDGSWAVIAFLYAGLCKYSRDSILVHKTKRLASRIASSVKEESEYLQLYFRLSAATPMDRHLPDRLSSIAKTQVASLVAKSRLNAFVAIVLTSLTVMTVSVVGPIVMAICSATAKIALLEEWRQWPVPWEGLFGAVSVVMKNLFHTLESLGGSAFHSFLENPIQFSFHLTMICSLFVCALLPGLEERRAIVAKTKITDEDDVAISYDSAEEWSRLGTSSASRLSMLSENGSVENALARWRASRVTPLDESLPYGVGLSSLLRLAGYSLVAALLAGSPLVVSYFLGGATSSISSARSIFRWDSLFHLSILQFSFFAVVFQAFRRVIESVNDISVVKNFQADLVSTKQEMEENDNSNAAFQVMGSVSPSAGIAVRDLWAAHSTKRAWAVRGASLQCKNGEILAVLGEDGNGKTRLLTTLAEALTFPPKRTTTTNKVRGLISIGGLDVSKWNHKMLKRRLGILLSDVRMVADSASLFSGWTMEEILEPVDGLRPSSNDPLQRTYTKAEKSAMLLALKVRQETALSCARLVTYPALF
jgi:ABC-type multidrug transport system fused ATPase/permease subunit